MALQAIDSESPLRKEKKTGLTFRGQEIVLSKARGRQMEGIPKKMGWYPDEKRLEVVSLYACIGDPVRISDLTGVPCSTIRTWRRESWFREVLEEIREENNEKLDALFSEIVDKSQKLIQDRLENGDSVVTKNGEIVQKPIGIRDLTYVSSQTIDKRQLIRNKPTSISEKQTTPIITRLEQLAETFKSLANKKEIKFNREVVQDVEFKEIEEEPQVLDEPLKENLSAEETGQGFEEEGKK